MNILLDGHFLDKKKEGSRTFIFSYLEGLARLHDPERQLMGSLSFTVPVFQPEYWQNYFVNLRNVRFIKTFHDPFLRNSIDFPRKISSLRIDLLQSIYYLPMLFRLGCKKVLVIHDVLPFTHPQYFSGIFRFKFKKLVRQAQKKADCIVCGSYFSKTAIQDTLTVEDRRVRVIPYGINVDRFAKGGGTEGLAGWRSGFPKAPFILVVGRLDPRKGLRLVLDLFAKLLLEMDVRLVLVGGSDALAAAEMRAIARLKAEGRLYWFQNISDEALTGLYGQAKLLLFFPEIEGFGLPVLEAMAAGLPYLAIPQGGLQEIAIPEAWVDAQKPEHMYRKALQLLDDEKLRESFIQKGHGQIQKYRCEDMVRQYLQLYQEC